MVQLQPPYKKLSKQSIYPNANPSCPVTAFAVFLIYSCIFWAYYICTFDNDGAACNLLFTYAFSLSLCMAMDIFPTISSLIDPADNGSPVPRADGQVNYESNERFGFEFIIMKSRPDDWSANGWRLEIDNGMGLVWFGSCEWRFVVLKLQRQIVWLMIKKNVFCVLNTFRKPETAFQFF